MPPLGSTSRSLMLVMSRGEPCAGPGIPRRIPSFDPEPGGQHRGDLHTRVAPSFLRWGHWELFRRRARKRGPFRVR